MSQDLKTSLDNAKEARDSKRFTENCLQMPPDFDLQKLMAETGSKQTGMDDFDAELEFEAKMCRTIQWVSDHCDPNNEENKQDKAGAAILEMETKFLPERKVTSNAQNDDGNKAPDEAEITDEVDVALVKMNAEGMAGENRSMYYVKVSNIIAAQIERAQQTHETLTHDIQHLKAEGRKLLQLMRMTRTHLMVENELKMMYGG